MRKLLTSTVAAALVATPALAGDLAYPAKAPAPFTAPMGFNWTGIWVGAQIGGGFGAQPLDLGPLGLSGVPGLTNLGNAGAIGQNSSGFFAGPHVEALWQIPATNVVLGLGADWNYSTLGNAGSASAPATVGPAVVGLNTSTGDVKLNWDASVYAKAGLTFGSRNQILLYAIGGLGLGQVSAASQTTTTVTNTIIANAVNNTHTGWTAGLGAAWELGDGWAINGEWRFVDLGSTTFTASAAATGLRGITLTTDPSGSMQYNKFMLGVSKQL